MAKKGENQAKTSIKRIKHCGFNCRPNVVIHSNYCTENLAAARRVSKRDSRSIYGFLNIKTGQENAFKTKRQNMYITYDVLEQLRKVYPSQRLFIFWDKSPWHKGSRARQFIQEDGNMETFDFPRAAPDENPQEHVWKSGRSKITHNEFIDNIDQATDKFVNYLNETKFNYSFLGCSAS